MGVSHSKVRNSHSSSSKSTVCMPQCYCGREGLAIRKLALMPLGGGLSLVGNRALQSQGPHPEPASRRHTGAFHLPALPLPTDAARAGIDNRRLAGGRWSAVECAGVVGGSGKYCRESTCPQEFQADWFWAHCRGQDTSLSRHAASCRRFPLIVSRQRKLEVVHGERMR